MDDKACRSHLVRLGLLGFIVGSGLSLIGCPQPIPRVSIPSSDPSPPTMIWQTYNMLTKESGQIVKDGQSLDVPAGEQYVLTLVVEDLISGVKDVTLNGNVQYTCEQDGQVENKKFPLETQETKPTADHENKVPVTASLVYAVEFGQLWCKEKLDVWGRKTVFGGQRT